MKLMKLNPKKQLNEDQWCQVAKIQAALEQGLLIACKNSNGDTKRHFLSLRIQPASKNVAYSIGCHSSKL